MTVTGFATLSKEPAIASPEARHSLLDAGALTEPLGTGLAGGRVICNHLGMEIVIDLLRYFGADASHLSDLLD